MAAAFWQVELAVADAAAAEGLANFLWELGALGVVEDDGADRSRLRGFFAGTASRPGLEARIDDYLDALRRLGFVLAGHARVEPLEDGRWAEAWREHFRPLEVGHRFLVVPPWERDAAREGRITLVIEPGRAFGTGRHGTTAGCLVRLEALMKTAAPSAAIDLGTGSGILAIAAAKLGVARVLAVDDDPDAVASAAANAAANGVAGHVTCRRADAADVAGEAPLVLANLLAAAHARLAPVYRRLVTPGGRLVLGGILDAEATAVVTEMRRHGFAAVAGTSLDGWTTLELART